MTYSHINSLLIITTILVVPLLSTQINSALAISWDVSYSADTLPDEDPSHPWILSENFDNDGGVATVSDGILKLNTSSEAHQWGYQQENYWDPDNSVGWTFEVRLKTDAQYTERASILAFADGVKVFTVDYFQDRTNFYLGDGTGQQRLTNNAYFRTYRICLKGADLKVYLEGWLFFTGTVVGSTDVKLVKFGDPHDGFGAVSHWDYVAWKYGYYPPSPVGGVLVPVDKFGLLAPYIGVYSTILVAAAATAIYVKRVKRRKKNT